MANGNALGTDVSLALLLLNTLLGYIAQIRGQGGLTDDQLAAQVQTITKGNDDAYNALMAALSKSLAGASGQR